MLRLGYAIDDTVVIDGKQYNLDLAFDNVIRLIDMFEDVEIDGKTKIETALLMLIDDTLDQFDIEQKQQIFEELFKSTVANGEKNKAQPVDLDGNPMPSDESDEKVYSLKEDADFVYASFMQDYGIDLIEQQGKLHWYKFIALLTGLRGDTKFREVVEIRTMELPTGRGTEKQREQIQKAKRQFALKGDD